MSLAQSGILRNQFLLYSPPHNITVIWHTVIKWPDRCHGHHSQQPQVRAQARTIEKLVFTATNQSFRRRGALYILENDKLNNFQRFSIISLLRVALSWGKFPATDP